MEWRVWLGRHNKGVQAAAVLLAVALTVVLTIRVDRNLHLPPKAVTDKTNRDPFGLLDDTDASKPKNWPMQTGPDKSFLLLVTKCVDGSVYFQFDAFVTPQMLARYRRTYGKGERFDLALVDSSGFKTGSIRLNEEDLIAENDSTGKITFLSAKDAIKLSCKEYLKLKAWEPAWTLAP